MPLMATVHSLLPAPLMSRMVGQSKYLLMIQSSIQCIRKIHQSITVIQKVPLKAHQSSHASFQSRIFTVHMSKERYLHLHLQCFLFRVHLTPHLPALSRRNCMLATPQKLLDTLASLKNSSPRMPPRLPNVSG